MDKRGDPIYFRPPLKMRVLIDEQRKKEGRGLAEMVLHLIARGLHASGFDVNDYCNSFDEDQGNKC